MYSQVMPLNLLIMWFNVPGKKDKITSSPSVSVVEPDSEPASVLSSYT